MDGNDWRIISKATAGHRKCVLTSKALLNVFGMQLSNHDIALLDSESGSGHGFHHWRTK